ncbi:MAG: phage portal protein [Prevotellaceae bacterium]|jgi:SPP1 family phage portal protein|nr:phage portal protein [Prevotellaceae bacterium]
MNIEQLLKENDNNSIIDELKKGRNAPEPDIDLYLSQLDLAKHDIFDKIKRQDKTVKVDNPEPSKNHQSLEAGYTGGEKEQTKEVAVARIALAIQKLIVKRAVAFTFGNQVILNAEPQNDDEKIVLKAVNGVLFDAKSRTVNRKVARIIFSATEAAEYWYPVLIDKTFTGKKLFNRIKDAFSNITGNKYHTKYGFKSKWKLKVSVFSPVQGDKLYPYFDETGDMIAFSREFAIVDKAGEKHTYFETYTDAKHLMWEQEDNVQWKLADGYPKENVIGKIPVIYGQQEAVEWEDVQGLIDRLETLLSNFADTNDYHASPKVVVKGEILGFAQKGESGAILQLEGEDADAKYLSWEHAPESVKLEIETLLRMIYTITQTPDISFDSVKGIGSISGIALKLLFMDAHLKVQDKMEIFDDYLQRRISIIQAYIAKFKVDLQQACETLTIEPQITPYTINNEQEKVDLLISANGNKPVISQKTSVQQLGWVDDVNAELRQIIDEENASAYRDITEPTI